MDGFLVIVLLVLAVYCYKFYNKYNNEKKLREAMKEKLATLLVDEDRFLKEEANRLARIHIERWN